MSDVITFTPEQFKEFLATVKAPAKGLGRPVGLGCEGSCDPLAGEVYRMLALGSPRLAYAKALGVRLVPYYFNIRATFDNVDTTDIPEVGADVKIVEDTLIDSMLVRIYNKSSTANQNQFQTQTDWYFTWQSGIEATFDVQGAPRPTLAPKFTPLGQLADAFNGDAHSPRGFVLTYQQQLAMAFHASVSLPYAPLEVVVTFRSFTPDNDMFVEMTNRQAFEGLAAAGFACNDAYVNRVLSVCR